MALWGLLAYPCYLLALFVAKALSKTKMCGQCDWTICKLLRTISYGMVFTMFLITAYFGTIFYLTIKITTVEVECSWYCKYLISLLLVNSKEEQSELELPLYLLTIIVLCFSITVHLYWRLVTSKPSRIPTDQQRSLQQSLYYNNCKKCNLERAAHVYHGEFSCVYMYDHTCPWVCNDIGASNKGIFYRFLLILLGLVVSTSIFPVTALRRQMQNLVALLGPRFFRGSWFNKLNAYTILLCAMALGNKKMLLLTIITLLNFMILIPVVFEMIQQAVCLRSKYCWQDTAQLKMEYREIKKGTLMMGCRDNSEYIFVECEKNSVQPENGKVKYLGEVISVEYKSKAEALRILRNEIKGSAGIIRNFVAEMRNAVWENRWQ